MSFLNSHLLTAVIFLPLAVAAILLLIPSRYASEIRIGALFAAVGDIALCSLMVLVVNQSGEFDFVERCAWIPSLNINYHVGADGASCAMMLFSAVILAISVLSLWRESRPSTKPLCVLLLLATTGAMGAFASMDVFAFCFFLQVAVAAVGIAMGLSRDRGARAVIKYAMFTGVSLGCLIAAAAYASQVAGSSDILAWYSCSYSPKEQLWIFSLLAISFGILTPLIPLHSWLADAVEKSQIPVGILQVGVILKLGCYGFFRIAIPSFPMAAAFFTDTILVLAVAGITAGSLLMMVQSDLRKFVAYSAIPQGGIIMLGLISMNTTAAAGSIMQMANFGLTGAAMLFAIGMMMDRQHGSHSEGVALSAKRIPLIAAAFVMIALSFVGMPGLNNFSGELMVFMGSFQTQTLFSAIGMAGLFFMIAGMMWLVARTFFGSHGTSDDHHPRDMGPREFVAMAAMIASMLLLGLFPNAILAKLWHPAKAFVMLSKRTAVEQPTTLKTTPNSAIGNAELVYNRRE